MNRTPMKKPIPGPGKFVPYRPKPHTDSAGRKIRRIITGPMEKEFLELCDALTGLEVRRVVANKTGRKVHAFVCVLGHSEKISVSPFEGLGLAERTVDSVAEELLETFARKPLKGAETGLAGDSMVKLVSDLAHEDAAEGEYFGYAVIMTVLSGELARRIPNYRNSGIGRLQRAVSDFVSSGGHLGNFDSHQKTKAMESFRQMACHAFKHGATLEDMTKALEEEMVRATMEA